MVINFFKKLQYILIRKIEKYPYLNLLILNNLFYFRFFLPHEKDFLGMKLILKNNLIDAFVDVGANIGASSMSFRNMGFKNPIYLFEPNFFLFENKLKKLLPYYKNLFLFNFALSNKNAQSFFYLPFIGKQCIHYFSSFDKLYIINSIKKTFKDINFSIKKKKIRMMRFDDLNINKNISFIKIDAEGHDHEVIQGFKETIAKYKPILLIEFNKENFFQIKKELNDYYPYIYNINKNIFNRVKKSLVNENIDRSDPNNLLSIRNIYFFHKSYLKNCLKLFQ